MTTLKKMDKIKLQCLRIHIWEIKPLKENGYKKTGWGHLGKEEERGLWQGWGSQRSLWWNQ